MLISFRVSDKFYYKLRGLAFKHGYSSLSAFCYYLVKKGLFSLD